MRLRASAIAFLTCLSALHAAAEWPDWRGPNADGHTDATGLPMQWSETEHVLWKTPIHDFGHSTPVIWGDQVWLTTAKEDGTELYAVCLDLKSGAVIHDFPVFMVQTPQRINPSNTYATPSAVIEAGRVYVHYGTAGTACIDTATAKVLWRREDLNCEHMQGPASSPILFGDLLIVTLEGTDKFFTAALDKKTGKTVWQYDRPADLYTEDVQGVYKKSYQTPVVLEIDGEPQLVSNGALLVTGHNLKTGEEIWRVRYRDDSTISRIVAGNGLMFINTGGSPTATQLYAVKMGGKGDVTDTHVVWKMLEDVPHESSPVLVDDLLYTMNSLGALICAEAATGKQVWLQKLDGRFWPSLLAAPGRIYVTENKGKTIVIAPGREYKELAVNQLEGEMRASPAVAGNTLVLRTASHVYRIGE